MNGTLSHLSYISPSSHQSRITLADGSTFSIHDLGSANLGHFSLQSILYVHKLPLNLVSVSRITKLFDNSVTLFPTHCVFQDLMMLVPVVHGKLN